MAYFSEDDNTQIVDKLFGESLAKIHFSFVGPNGDHTSSGYSHWQATRLTREIEVKQFIDDATRSWQAGATDILLRSRSPSDDIIPPASSQQSLAAVKEAAYRSKSNNTRRVAEEDDAPPTVPTKKRQSPDIPDKPDAPAPCLNCFYSSKPCKGIAGSSCENCKQKKMKCSYRTVPAHRKQAGATAPTTSSQKTLLPAPKAVTSKAAVGEVSTSNLKPTSPPRDEVDREGSVESEDGHESPPRPNKKRRLSKGTGPTHARLVNAVTDMEASVSSSQRNVDKMNSVINSPDAKIKSETSDD
ncbi:hypothetical protein D9619_013566 [Psilocybe cf. subviscida]|uniref:Zn(2)-C6 fungal-type domain-containing protein n=1 Tax=Psilocybe cf. subviscida TaxID=2480587 RepID=A0A8H5APV1_9AGAR|nr:hypothetical protein D9619_013566 [Psilocybe cf. subviscida]